MAKDNALLPAYLAVGEDELKRRRVLDRLHKRLETFGDLAFNSDRFDGESASGDDIVGACNTLPFASEVRLVEVVNVEKLKKADSEKLVGYLKAPCTTTILIMSAGKLAKTTRLYKAVAAVAKTAVIDCAPMKRKELVQALRSMAVSHGFTMTPGACQKLVDLVGEDTVRIDTELKKLALAHSGNDPVNESEVTALVAQTVEAKPWDFVDAFSARNTARCFHLLPLLKSSSPYSLLAQCQTRLRELICTQSLMARGQTGSLPSVLGVPSWRVRNHTTWARGFTNEELERALITSRDAEMRMKSGADPLSEFRSWFTGVTVRK